MPYVYLLRSERNPAQTYVGITSDVEQYLKSGSGRAFVKRHAFNRT
jgi:predicted GIY-YIG superfamily endonuclease